MSPSAVEPSQRRILALGGLEIGTHTPDAAMTDYVLSLSPAPEPRICLLPTASGDPEDQIQRFRMAYANRGCVPSALSLFRLGTSNVSVRDHLLAQDIVFVGGGSLVNLLAIWRVHGVDEILREAWARGIVLCGLSAGSMCWFEAGVTTGAGVPAPAAGLGVLPGSNCVHYGSEPARRARFHRAVLDGAPAGYGVDDGAGLLFAGTALVDVVSARPDAGAYRVELDGAEVVESPLAVRRLEPAPDEDDDSVVELRALRQAMRTRAMRL